MSPRLLLAFLVRSIKRVRKAGSATGAARRMDRATQYAHAITEVWKTVDQASRFLFKSYRESRSGITGTTIKPISSTEVKAIAPPQSQQARLHYLGQRPDPMAEYPVVEREAFYEFYDRKPRTSEEMDRFLRNYYGT